MTAEIITIGDEILIGQVIDTNSAFIAQELNKIGISVHQITSIEDDRFHINKSLEDAYGRVDIIFMTGGLGPTKDDVTKYSLCEFFEDTLIKNEEVLQHVEDLFKRMENTPISDLNREQAMVPSTATVLHNKYGTAPGLWLKKGEKLFIAIPGVPFEMKMLLELEIIPKLKIEFKRPFIYHRTIQTHGLGESALAQRIENWEKNLPKSLKLAYLADLGSVRLRLSGKGENEEQLKNLVENEFEKLYPLLGDFLTNSVDDDYDITVTISQLLTSRQQFLSAAESFTGGELAAEFTINPGASGCFKGGIVTYATEAKEKILNVPKEMIQKYSVVSSQVAEKMAENAKNIFNSDYAIATTGNAGPTKGDSNADVGTVFIALATPKGVFSQKFVLGNSREQVVKKGVHKAFEMILKDLMKT